MGWQPASALALWGRASVQGHPPRGRTAGPKHDGPAELERAVCHLAPTRCASSGPASQGRLPDPAPPTGANGPRPPGARCRTQAGSGLFLPFFGSLEIPGQLSGYFFSSGGAGRGSGRALGEARAPRAGVVEQRVDGLRTLQHHHMTAFIDELPGRPGAGSAEEAGSERPEPGPRELRAAQPLPMYGLQHQEVFLAIYPVSFISIQGGARGIACHPHAF